MQQHNYDQKVVEGFGKRWKTFPQTEIATEERRRVFDAYFAVFPWQDLLSNAVGADAGATIS